MSMRITLDHNFPTKNILTIVISIPVFLFFIDSLGYHFRDDIPRKLLVLFDITLEANIPTWYSSMLALFVGMVGILIVEHYYNLKQNSKIAIWLLIALFFVYMSIDDVSQFHERVATAWAHYARSADNSISSSLASNFESYYWQLLFLPIFGSIAFAMLYVIKTEFVNKKAQYFFIIGLACFVFAVALDYIDGVDRYYDYIIKQFGFNFKVLEHFSRAVEEMVEMIGLGFILTALLLHQESLQLKLNS